ncbi:hypothetical protein IEE94_15205 [Yimella sp. cx-573]|nr:hypothetical protein [Yimella sp. cx-573]
MPLSKFDRILPWTGALAGLAWVAYAALSKTSTKDSPGGASTHVINDNLANNNAAQGALVLMGISLLFFATAARNLLRAGEAREATYSNIVYAGWIVVAAALAQMVAIGWALVNGAADADDQAAVTILGYLQYFSWAGLGIGVATAFIATGLGGLASAAVPKWFAIVSIVLGVLGALGNAGIPPGGLVTYLLLPVWLIVASIIFARRQKAAT